MFNFTRKTLIAVMAAGLAGPALAADPYEPVIEEAPPIIQETQYGGWYIRGDVGYHKSEFRGANYITYGPPQGTNSFNSGDLKGGFSLGGGVGYQITNHFRTDLTGDYWFKSNFRGSTIGTAGPGCTGPVCTSTEVSKMSALLLLANAYVDIGTWHGVTPYVGAGIGGAHVKWDRVYDPGTTEQNPGAKGWRFAYALMAGASYCLTDHAKLDVGYRFSHIQGGRMFEYHTSSSGPGFDKGLNNHEVRAGLRYSFGGSNNCSEPVTVVYEPEPIYTK